MRSLAVVLLSLLVAFASALIVVDPDIKRALDNKEEVNVLVHFPQFKSEVSAFSKTQNRKLARVQVREEREAHNLQFQPAFVSFLKEQGVQFKRFWITNTVLVKNVSPSLLVLLQRYENVIELELEKDVAHIIDPMVHEITFREATTPKFLEWNIELINTPDAWNTTTGEGITVSNIDTGVLYTHEALIANYRGNNGGSFDHDYNWFDPRGVQQQPYDNNGHGTHTMGTIAGSQDTGIGVAPGSKWIAAKGCASSSCSNADLIASAEYVVCPTRQGGEEEDCTKGADLVSNSWGGGRGSSTYKTYIQAWLDAGMVPLFSQGNSGSSCSTANSPGDLGLVIGIGSTDKNDALSSFSSRGPGIGSADFPLQKPDISAPGEAVRSSYPTSNSAYASLSGTSMACPHVAGLVALMLSANPSLSVDSVREILFSTAEQDLETPKGGQTSCDGVAWDNFPSYHYGHGRIDASAAVNAASKY